MAKIIIEIINHQGVLQEYRTFDSFPVRIGRGYQNDLILYDPYVSQEHLKIVEDHAGWVAQDLNSKNGLYLYGHPKTLPEIHLASGGEILIGKTRLRLLSSLHPVPSAVSISTNSKFWERIDALPNMMGLVLILFLLVVLQSYFDSIKNLSLGKLASVAVGVIVTVVIWAGSWAFVGRLIKHRTFFCAQLSWISLYYVASIILFEFSSYIRFFTCDHMIVITATLILFGVLFAVLLMGHLTMATAISLRKQMAASGMISLVIILISLQFHFVIKNEFNPVPEFYSKLCPPFIKFKPARSIDKFIDDSKGLFVALEKRKQEEKF